MAVDIHKLIATINPRLFCSNEVDSNENRAKSEILAEKVKEAMTEKKEEIENKGKKVKIDDVAKVLISIADKEKIKVRETEFMDFDEITYKNAFDAKALENPVERHTLSYDAFGESLEPVYFWILDNVKSDKVVKLVDNFNSSPGSGFNLDMGQKSRAMQDESMRILGNVNTVIKSILNLIYDLKEFKTRLNNYKELHSEDKLKAEAALLGLKQIWMDQVDIKKQATSIRSLAMAGANQPSFVTLIDAFMAARDREYIDKLDLNDRVRRLLKQRYSEFDRWVSDSEVELTKRYNIEKNYLKVQMASLKLYAKWLKPYLKASHELEQEDKKDAALVSMFNTMILELVLLSEKNYSPKEEIDSGDLPQIFKELAEKKEVKEYKRIMIIEFKFRSAPERMQQGGYGARGKIDVSFSGYALTDFELQVLKKAMEEDDSGDGLRLIEEATGESIQSIEKDIADVLEEKKKDDEEDEERPEDVNPFSAIIGMFKSNKKEGKEEKSVNFPEKMKNGSYEDVLRSLATISARKDCRKLYDNYKKAHGMPSFPSKG